MSLTPPEATMHMLLPILLLACLLPTVAQATTTVTKGTDPTKHVLRGAIVQPDATVLNGEVVIEGDTITCVMTDCSDPPGASVLVISDGFIFPGFIDAHNHVAYNFLPKWTAPKLFAHRGLWQSAPAYKAFKAPYDALLKSVPCEMVRYGEIAALISGITSVQGTPNRICNKGLVRNIENQNDLPTLSADHIRTSVLSISSFKDKIDFTKTRSFVPHIAEGIGETPRKEFDVLKAKGLLRSETAIIHGTAFGEPEFAEMGKAGAKLIWSPQSNLALYAQTTNIPLALKHGVEVSLGVDWNPSGSDTIFDELRVAKQVDEEQWGNVIGDALLVQMITTNPARALAVDTLLGTVLPGRKADLTIIRSRDAVPGRSLLRNGVADVEMVWIGGQLLYGTAAVVQTMRPSACEALMVQGAGKRICTPVLPLVSTLEKAYPWLVPVVR
jgi:5-methylthioadenosine/S-adenosylhomocysteine deaminase